MTKLWHGTPLEAFADNVRRSESLQMAYYIGQVEQKISEIFAHNPLDDHAPLEARQVALLYMRINFGQVEVPEGYRQIQQIVDQWRARLEVH